MCYNRERYSIELFRSPIIKEFHMKHITKIISLLLLAATLLTGCVQGEPPSDDTRESTEAENTEATPPTDEVGSDTGNETDPETETQLPTLYNPDPADSTIPVISVTTADEQPITSKTKYKNATITVSGAADDLLNSIRTPQGEVKILFCGNFESLFCGHNSKLLTIRTNYSNLSVSDLFVNH